MTGGLQNLSSVLIRYPLCRTELFSLAGHYVDSEVVWEITNHSLNRANSVALVLAG